MRKFYSIVLMAAALLVGTNVNAINVAKIGSQEYATIEEAFAAVGDGETATITLLSDVNNWNSAIEVVNKTITLDFAGYNMPGGDNARLWIKLGGHVVLTGKGLMSTTTTANTMFVRMEGSSDPAAVKASSLEVGPDVTISGGAYGISVYGWNTHKENDKNVKNDYGVYVKVEGTVSTDRPGLYVEGNFKATAGNGPIFDVERSAQIIVPGTVTMIAAANSGEGKAVKDAGFTEYGYSTAAIYAAGYSTWNIKGTVVGGNSIYVKGGHVNVDGGTILATANEYWRPLFYTNGYVAAGCGIILDNNSGYCPVISMHITGNTVVSAESGSAIEELVTKGTEKMGAEDFVIESGTFTSGTDQNGQPHDAVVVTDQLGTEVKNEGTVSGGMFSTPVNNILHVTGEMTEVVVDGKTYQIIHEASDPSKTLANSTISDNVKMDGTAATYTVAADATAKARYLELANGATVNVEGTLIIGVEGVVIKDASKLTVKAGGRLIINAGIVTSSVDQLIVEASETNTGLLVAAPGVAWNAQPFATVQFYTLAKQYGAKNNLWQRIATPLSVYASMSNDFSGTTQDGAAFTTWCNEWNYATDKWSALSNWNQLKAFAGYALTNNSVNGGVTYSFKGNLQGGVTSDLTFNAQGFNFFGNSYTAPITVATLLGKMVAAGSDDAIHLWDAAKQRYISESKYYLDLGLVDIDKIPALQTFILKWNGGDVNHADLDYAASVWAPYANEASTGNASPKPALKRSMPNNLTIAQINITSANGDMDQVILVEGEQFSEAFDNGADIAKYMEEKHINVYAEGAEKYSAMAVDDLEGTTLAIQAQNEINYTMTFSNIHGTQYAVKDMLTGVVTKMVEGAEYHFVAQANATTEGRFQIVGAMNAPTAVENVETVAANVKGIYTVLGQYVGEVEMWDILPAGIYVVDGVKIVK